MSNMANNLAKLFRKKWRWLHSDDWNDIVQLEYPGVYLLAHQVRNLAGIRVKVDDVYYVGMSNSAGGVRARLKQFKNAIEKGSGHSAGDYIYGKNKRVPFSKLVSRKKFYFAALNIPCQSSKKSAEPIDFKKMGQVACLECYAIAHVLARSAGKKVPVLNRSAGGRQF